MGPTISPPLLSKVDPTNRLAGEYSDSSFLPGAEDLTMVNLGDVESACYSNDILLESGLQLENDWSADCASTSCTRDGRLFCQFLRARSPRLSPSCLSRAYSLETMAAEGVPQLEAAAGRCRRPANYRHAIRSVPPLVTAFAFHISKRHPH